MTEKGNTGLIWEHRLALWLPRSPLMGALLIAGSFSAAYLSFQWFFDLRADRIAFGVGLLITWTLMWPRYFAAPVDPQRQGREVLLSDRHETGVGALQMPVSWRSPAE